MVCSDKLEKTTVVSDSIETTDENPISCNAYHTSPFKRQIIKEQFDAMLAEGIVGISLGLTCGVGQETRCYIAVL